MELEPAARRLVVLACALTAALAAPASAAEPLDLETLDGPTAVRMMEQGTLTSVELTRQYIARIAALNKRGPGLNAVTQLNHEALKDAARLDKERKAGTVRGPAHGLPILLKDLIDVKGMYTSAGNFSLRNSFPETDSGDRQEAARERRGDPRQARPVRVRELVRQPAVGLQQPHRPGHPRARRRPEPERLLVGLRHRRHRRALDAHRGHGDGRLDHLALAGAEPRRAPADGGPHPRLRRGADPALRRHRRADGPHGGQRGADAAVDRRHRPDQRRLLPRVLGPGHRPGDRRPAAAADRPELQQRARPELRARQAHRLERHVRPGQPGQGGARPPRARSSSSGP